MAGGWSWSRLLLPLFALVCGLVAESWTVYEHREFDKEPLCQLLECGKHEKCLVKGEKALCADKLKIHEIKGKKIHHSRLHHKEKNADDHQAVKLRIHKETEATCNEDDLKSMGGRLLQWFSDVHEQAEHVQMLPLHKHKIACRPDVAWMFRQWDGDDDGVLSAGELKPLEMDGNEKCLAAFLDHCDTDSGSPNALTVDEWCDCFTWADNIRKEPPCHFAKHKEDPHKLGAFHPRCDPEGYFHPEQCHEHECWCVDKFGREFDHSRISGALPDCGQYATELDDDERENLTAEL